MACPRSDSLLPAYGPRSTPRREARFAADIRVVAAWRRFPQLRHFVRSRCVHEPALAQRSPRVNFLTSLFRLRKLDSFCKIHSATQQIGAISEAMEVLSAEIS